MQSRRYMNYNYFIYYLGYGFILFRFSKTAWQQLSWTKSCKLICLSLTTFKILTLMAVVIEFSLSTYNSEKFCFVLCSSNTKWLTCGLDLPYC